VRVSFITCMAMGSRNGITVAIVSAAVVAMVNLLLDDI